MLKDLKFTETELGDKDISSLPDRPSDAGITAEELKARFDMIPKTLLALGKFNQMIDTLTDTGGAENIGTAPIEGIEGENVQAALIGMSTKTAEATAAAEAATQRATEAEAAAAAAAETATAKAEQAITAAETATAKADAAATAAETAAAQGKEAAEAAKLATDTVTEVKAYSEQKAQEAKDYVDNAILQSGAVTSVFGRAGAITAEAGDYTAEQITYGDTTVAEGIAGANAAAAGAAEAAATAQQTAAEALEKAGEKGIGIPPQIKAGAPVGSVVSCVCGETTLTAEATEENGGIATLELPDYGEWTISASLNGQTSNVIYLDVDTVKIYTVELVYFTTTLNLTVDTGSVVSVVKENAPHTLQTKTSVDGTVQFILSEAGEYTITAELDGETVTEYFDAAIDGEVAGITVLNLHIYGVQWDGTAASTWSRTDESAEFVDPVPAVAGGTGSSPFDSRMPWRGMVRVSDSEAGELVAIPKFWYKWTRSGSSMKLQIATNEAEGFLTSPAHADRGDGKGERDIVYVGRYHCGTDDYKSASGVKPKASITRATARTDIHALGEDIWQMDFATMWTIWMLYLVEFGNWNSQEAIGYGCGNGSATENMGASDTMQYHTGTMQADRATYGVGCQYRYIEDLWGNIFDWYDGVYFSGSNVYAILNPADFSDTANGTKVSTRQTSSGVPTTWGAPTAEGLEWALYPAAVTDDSTYSTYTCDQCGYNSSGVVLRGGGNCSQGAHCGLFCLSGSDAASGAYADIGCRLLKLP